MACTKPCWSRRYVTNIMNKCSSSHADFYNTDLLFATLSFSQNNKTYKLTISTVACTNPCSSRRYVTNVTKKWGIAMVDFGTGSPKRKNDILLV